MPQQPIPREFSAERQIRLRRAGVNTIDGKVDDGMVALLTAIQDIQADLAELKTRGVATTRAANAEHAGDALQVRIEIAQMVRIITQAKQEIASIKHPMSSDDRMLAAAGELDAIVLATETSTQEILSAAESIETLLRTIAGRHHEDDDLVAMTDAAAYQIIKIFEACNFQDITGQRINKVVKTIKFIEQRILSMIDIWGIEAFAELPIPEQNEAAGERALMNDPQLAGGGITQSDINALFD